ncbi:MAG TPA: hypothetical protein VHV74_13175 [Pseudonocardiaceae bacterium]|nr:hypothetical protein [Pseudonocardiaceae bacterium]
MTRRWLPFLPVALAIAGTATAPAVAWADDPIVNCTQDTQEVTDLAAALTTVNTALQATPLDPTTLGQASGDLFHAIRAAQRADCLPPLPSSPSPAPAPPPPAQPVASPQDAANCPADTLRLMSSVLDEISATSASDPDSSAILRAASDLATAVTAINTDTCLPVSVPVPTVPAPVS